MGDHNCRSVTVFCSSSNHVDAIYLDAAKQMGEAIAENGYRLVFGGGKTGLMGALSEGARQSGGEVAAVILKRFVEMGVADTNVSDMKAVDDMRARKQGLERAGDAYITLPGGFGTFEEVTEMISFKQLGFHNKPIIFLNVQHYFDALLEQFQMSMEQNFIDSRFRSLYNVVSEPQDAIACLKSYKPRAFESKYGLRTKSKARRS
ncbi:TIGR00730 family Rossman fold protein [bacterium]|nr:TIGR00730 family Rossman fold protein [bacterium]